MKRRIRITVEFDTERFSPMFCDAMCEGMEDVVEDTGRVDGKITSRYEIVSTSIIGTSDEDG